MPIILDTTTRGEYLALTTASSRASLVVSALSGTVVCEVYDGQDVLRASGTMASPWATASGATVTVGEVTGLGLNVTSGGTPDENWYCQFRSGTRFVRGTFGLPSSVNDFTWSLASFSTGSRGTIGTATLVAQGVLAVAPTNLVAPSILGTRSVGSVLTADVGTWLGSPTSYTYQWLRATTVGGAYSDITGATSSTYTLQAADETRFIGLRVTAINDAGSTAVSAVPVGAIGAFSPPTFVAANTITISLPTGSATNYPYQFGRVFRYGEIANVPQVRVDGVAITTQADVKNRHADGSVKFAVLSVVLPTLSTTPRVLSFQNQASGSNTPVTVASMLADYDFNCAINATVSAVPVTGAPVSARTMLSALSDATLATNTASNDPNSRYWTQGPICTTVILCDHTSKTYDFGTNASRVLRPIFHVQFWPTLGTYRVRVIVEGSDSQKMQDQTYDVSVTKNNSSPTTAYTRLAVPQHVGSRWTKAFWSGTAPASINVDHNATYLAETRAIPNYDITYELGESTIATKWSSWGSASKDIYQAGLWEKSMPNVGGRAEIALFPDWTIDALLSGDYRLQSISDTLAEIALSWPMHFREGNAGKLYDAAQTIPAIGSACSLYARPGMFFFDNNFLTYVPPNPSDGLTFVSGSTNNNGWAPDGAHQPSPFYLPYLTTGEYLWLEQMQFWASWGMFNPQPNTTTGFYGRGPTLTSFALNGDTRRQAWFLRNRVSVAAFSPDGSKEKTYFETSVNNALEIAEGVRGVTGGAWQGSAAYVWGQTTGRAGMFGGLGIHPLRFFDTNQGGTEAFAAGRASLFSTPIARAQSSFQTAYMIVALAHVQDLGYAAGGLLEWSAGMISSAHAEGLTGMVGGFVLPTATASPLANITTWTQAKSVFVNPNYAENEAISTIDSSGGAPEIFAAAAAMAYDVPGVAPAYSWMNTNWKIPRHPTLSLARRSGWEIIPRT
jgi:hypothetical protein